MALRPGYDTLKLSFHTQKGHNPLFKDYQFYHPINFIRQFSRMIPTKQYDINLNETSLEVKVFNQNKESHGLFDFENQNNNFEKLTIYRSGCIIRSGDKYETIPLNQIQMKMKEQDFHFIAYITYNDKEKQFDLQFDCPELGGPRNSEDKFIIPRTMQQNKIATQTYNLQAGDLFKLGKMQQISIQYNFSEFQVVEKRGLDLQVTTSNKFYSKHIHIAEEANPDCMFHCKFCLSETKQSIENPIISGICKCVGNLSYVHLKCMSLWVDQNIEKQETLFGATLQWTKAFECQVCKDALPMRITFKDRTYEMFEFDRPHIPYIIVEQLNRERECCTQLYLIHGWNTDPIKLGRGQGCDIRLNEITVSRQHATIQVNEEGYWLSDNNSKFGALVLVRNFKQIHECLRIQPASCEKLQLDFEQCGFQIGKTVFLFTTKQAKIGPQQISSIKYQNSPRLQQKLTKIPQISNQCDEDEPQMDEDSETESNKKKNNQPGIQ